MSDRELFKQALDALENGGHMTYEGLLRAKEAADALRSRLAQPEQEAAAELRRLHAENEAHRAFCGQIYTALGTSESDRTQWLEQIRRLHAENEELGAEVRSEARWAADYLARAVKAEAINAQLVEALEHARDWLEDKGAATQCAAFYDCEAALAAAKEKA